ncbi:hypothetical protein I540_4266 [Mycobacteroides abscessus subsp. bolletii 1513]|uniref:Uncharacterized protein n=1 Tax=Mycobacteroides abscessus subsp. bolletii 1513 TaxID=1299321 RepID=X8DHF5_9MYCO|nr:hypothetical protein I540_4266 [Mycobacteroides abscessus subsp. bolletii 1513]
MSQVNPAFSQSGSVRCGMRSQGVGSVRIGLPRTNIGSGGEIWDSKAPERHP